MISAIGVPLGIAGAFILTRLMRTSLFGVGTADPLTYALVSVLIVATALAACAVPARAGRQAGTDALAAITVASHPMPATRCAAIAAAQWLGVLVRRPSRRRRHPGHSSNRSSGKRGGTDQGLRRCR